MSNRTSTLTTYRSTDQPETRTAGDAVSWHPEQTFFLVDFNSLRAELQQLTPGNDELLRFAEKHPPDMSWWTDTTNPFEVEEDAEG